MRERAINVRCIRLQVSRFGLARTTRDSRPRLPPLLVGQLSLVRIASFGSSTSPTGAKEPFSGEQPFHSASLHSVAELVSRHMVVTCFRVLGGLPSSCNPRF